VATEDFVLNNGRDRQAVEAVGEGFPELHAVPALAWTVRMQYMHWVAVPCTDFGYQISTRCTRSEERHI
jgi:hypothetical protein